MTKLFYLLKAAELFKFNFVFSLLEFTNTKINLFMKNDDLICGFNHCSIIFFKLIYSFR